MSDINAQVLYNQLERLRRQGVNLNERLVLDCDTCGGEAIIVSPEDYEDTDDVSLQLRLNRAGI